MTKSVAREVEQFRRPSHAATTFLMLGENRCSLIAIAWPSVSRPVDTVKASRRITSPAPAAAACRRCSTPASSFGGKNSSERSGRPEEKSSEIAPGSD